MAKPIPVPAAPATPPRHSLLAAAQVLDNDTTGWQVGIAWTPEACGAGGVIPADCAPSPAREVPATPPAEQSHPFRVWAADECSTFGWQARDWQGRARRQLEATQSFQIARELWTGDLTRAEHAPGDRSPYLADDTTVVGAIPGGLEQLLGAQLAVIETWATVCSGGRRVMLHMSPMVLAAALVTAGDNFIVANDLVVTARGNLVVADAGYPGTPPDGQADDGMEWVYASPLVQVRLDAVETLPSSLADARGLAEMIDRPSNTATVWAQRIVAYQLDPCCRFAAKVAVPRSYSIPPTPTS